MAVASRCPRPAASGGRHRRRAGRVRRLRLVVLGLVSTERGPRRGRGRGALRAAAGRPGRRGVPVGRPLGARAAAPAAGRLPLGRRLRRARRAVINSSAVAARRRAARRRAAATSSAPRSSRRSSRRPSRARSSSACCSSGAASSTGSSTASSTPGSSRRASRSPRTSSTSAAPSPRTTDVGGGVLFALLILRGVLSPFAHPLFTSMTGIGAGIAADSRSAAAARCCTCSAATGRGVPARALEQLGDARRRRRVPGVYLVDHGAAVRRDGRRSSSGSAAASSARSLAAARRVSRMAGWIAPSEVASCSRRLPGATGAGARRAAALGQGGRAGRRRVPGGRHRPRVPARRTRARSDRAARPGEWHDESRRTRSSGRAARRVGSRRR